MLRGSTTVTIAPGRAGAGARNDIGAVDPEVPGAQAVGGATGDLDGGRGAGVGTVHRV